MPARTKRFRGTRTHGRGQKAGRGAGFLGGRGRAGYHKHKYMKVMKYFPEYFGKRGFKPKGRKKEYRTINLSELEEKFDELVQKEIIKKIDDLYTLELRALGYDKLLGAGRFTKKLKIIAPKVSKIAKDKISALGGEVVSEVE